MDLSEYDSLKRNKVLVYGPPKSGKTAIVGKLAEAGFKLWWFDLENGIKTLLNPAIVKPEFRKNISVFTVPDHRAYPVAIDVMRRLFKGGAMKLCAAHGAHACPICQKTTGSKWSEEIDLGKFGDKDILVIDSQTQLANSAANKVTLKAWQKDDEYKMTFDDYRMQGMYMDEILSKMQVANVHVCIVSHEVDVEKSESKEKIVPVGGTRNFSKTVAKYFDSVVYMQVSNKQHRALSTSTSSTTILTGSRLALELDDKKGGDLSLAGLFGPT